MNHQDHELAAQDPWLRRLARRLARSRARADDLVQDTYVTALRNAPPDAQIRPWLHTVMRKLAWGQVRGEQRRVQREESFALTAPMQTLPEVLADHGVDRERLAAALGTLPEPFQSTIVQRFLQGRSCAEIARRDNVPAGTVRWRQSRGLELLRHELAPSRRRYVFWALPFLGAGERLVARFWQALAARLSGSKAIGLLLACAAVLYAIIGGQPQRSVAGSVVEARDGLAFADGWPPGAAASAQTGGDPRGSRISATSDRGDAVDGEVAALVPDRVEPIDRAAEPRAARRDVLDLDRDDCTWDPVHGRRCVHASVAPSPDARCALLGQQLAAAEALALGARNGRVLLSPALLAQRALAQRLGCAIPRPDGVGRLRAGGPPAGARPGGGAAPPGGAASPDAPPAPDGTPAPEGTPPEPEEATHCETRTVATGITCTVCLNDNYIAFSDCPVVPSPHCDSEIASAGLLCSTCDDQPGPPECLAAQCASLGNGCVRCIDPKDRSATSCERDDDHAFTIESGTAGGGSDNFMGTCVEELGDPFVAGTTCHYPGTQSCIAYEKADTHCLYCMYRGGSMASICMDASLPLPDPLADRPHDLPAPGLCVTELGADGTAACTTCTRADLSATRSCR